MASLLSRFAFWRKSASTLDLFRELFGGRETKSGQTVNIRTALEVSVVIACGRVIAEGMAQVPCKVLKRDADGGRTEAREHPLFRLLHRKPNDWQTAFEFREQIGLHLALAGNAFVFKNIVNGRVIELLPFEPGWVTVKRAGWDLAYRVQMPEGEPYDVPAENMWHIRGPSWNGYTGLDCVHQARNAIGLALATEEFGSKLFANGARPGGLLVTDQVLGPDVVKRLREDWKEQQGGERQLSTGILYGGMKYVPLSTTPEDAQFIETRKLAIREVCRFMRVMPIMVMDDEGSAAFASVESRYVAHHRDTLAPWFERFDQSATVNLLTEKEQNDGLYVKLMANGLLRGTAKDRAEYNQIMAQNGVITVNEWRESEDMNRVTDPEADKLRPAANLYGPKQPTPTE